MSNPDASDTANQDGLDPTKLDGPDTANQDASDARPIRSVNSQAVSALDLRHMKSRITKSLRGVIKEESAKIAKTLDGQIDLAKKGLEGQIDLAKKDIDLAKKDLDGQINLVKKDIDLAKKDVDGQVNLAMKDFDSLTKSAEASIKMADASSKAVNSLTVFFSIIGAVIVLSGAVAAFFGYKQTTNLFTTEKNVLELQTELNAAKVKAEKTILELDQRIKGLDDRNEQLRAYNAAYKKLSANGLKADCQKFLEDFSISKPNPDIFRLISDNQRAISNLSAFLGKTTSDAGKVATDADSSLIRCISKVNEGILLLDNSDRSENWVADVLKNWKGLEFPLTREERSVISDPDYIKFIDKELPAYVRNVEAVLHLIRYGKDHSMTGHLADAETLLKHANDLNPAFSRLHTNKALLLEYKLEREREKLSGMEPDRLMAGVEALKAGKREILKEFEYARAHAKTSRSKSIALNDKGDLFYQEASSYIKLSNKLLVDKPKNLDQKILDRLLEEAGSALDAGTLSFREADRLVDAVPTIYVTQAELRTLRLALAKVKWIKDRKSVVWDAGALEEALSIISLLKVARELGFAEFDDLNNVAEFLKAEPSFELLIEMNPNNRESLKTALGLSE